MTEVFNAQYVRCIDNRQFIRAQGEEPPNEEIYGLTVGRVYKRIPDSQAEGHQMVRIIDESFGEAGSEQGYMYPANYFEPLDLDKTDMVPLYVRVPSYIKDILHAEAVASDKALSNLVRSWIDEHLDLAEPI